MRRWYLLRLDSRVLLDFPYELDDAALRLGLLDVLVRDLCYASYPDIFDREAGPEHIVRCYHELAGGVEAADIVGRIRLCVAQLLGLCQRGLHRHPFRCHLAEYEVGSPVEDPADRTYLAPFQALLGEVKDGSSAADCAAELQEHVVVVGQLHESGHGYGERSLVGADHVPPFLERRPDMAESRLAPPEVGRRALDHDLALDVLDDFQGVPPGA